MNLLLDTHILLWSLLEPERLPSFITSALTHTDTQLWVSPITTWEILVLHDKNRIQLDNDPVEWMREIFETIPIHEAPLNHEVALQSRSIRLKHSDPADKFLAATTIVYDLTLVTLDKQLLDCPDIECLKQE